MQDFGGGRGPLFIFVFVVLFTLDWAHDFFPVPCRTQILTGPVNRVTNYLRRNEYVFLTKKLCRKVMFIFFINTK